MGYYIISYTLVIINLITVLVFKRKLIILSFFITLALDKRKGCYGNWKNIFQFSNIFFLTLTLYASFTRLTPSLRHPYASFTPTLCKLYATLICVSFAQSFYIPCAILKQSFHNIFALTRKVT